MANRLTSDSNTVQYMVCIHCMTYNHEKYLADALEGFVMQKTDFPFVAVVIDDCSTDGTADVLRRYEEKYPEIIKAVYLKENYYSQHKSKQPFLEPWDSKSKYIALCEGDDYWTDPLKLQKQVDILEKHPEYTACFNRVQVVDKFGNPKNGQMPKRKWKANRAISLFDFCKENYGKIHWLIHTSSYCFKAHLYNEYLGNIKGCFIDFPYGDMPLILTCLLEGNAYCLSDVCGCYRTDSGGYNSACKINPEKRIADERKLYVALRKFDQQTNKKYHRFIEHRILWGEFGNDGGTFNVIFRPKYWILIFSPVLLNLLLCSIKHNQPRFWTFAKKIKSITK